MRKITKKIIETVIREDEIYECEISGCGFVTGSKSKADYHYGKVHTLKRRERIDNTDFLFFDSENDAREYWKWYQIRHNKYDEDISEFNGCGWYYIVHEVYQIGIQPAVNELERLLDEQVDLKLRYEKIERLINEE